MVILFREEISLVTDTKTDTPAVTKNMFEDSLYVLSLSFHNISYYVDLLSYFYSLKRFLQ